MGHRLRFWVFCAFQSSLPVLYGTDGGHLYPPLGRLCCCVSRVDDGCGCDFLLVIRLLGSVLSSGELVEVASFGVLAI